MNDPIVALYAAITTTSLAVLVLYLPAAWAASRAAWSAWRVRWAARRANQAILDTRRSSRADQLVLGIVASFAFQAVYYPYWIAWRLGGAEVKSSLVSHWFLPALALLLLLAGLLHIRAATQKRCGERGWLTVAALAIAAAALADQLAGL
jgi:hypothetical protein